MSPAQVIVLSCFVGAIGGVVGAFLISIFVARTIRQLEDERHTVTDPAVREHIRQAEVQNGRLVIEHAMLRRAFLALKDGASTQKFYCTPLPPTSDWRKVVDFALSRADSSDMAVEPLLKGKQTHEKEPDT